MQRVKTLVARTPFGGIARKAYHLFVPPPPRPQPADLAARNNAYDEQTVAVMRRWLRRDSNCIDVGCHAGSILKEVLRLAPNGTHYAFEPLPSLYQNLIRAFPRENVFDIALSDSVGEAGFQYVTSNPGYSGLKQRKYDRPNETIEEIQVRTDLLDNVIPDDLPIRLIKIDVEGGELQVLKGAVNSIRRSKPVVIFEHGLGAADYYGTTPQDVYDLLAGCGLSLSLMEDWLRGARPLNREEFADRFHRGEFYFMAYP